jgi:nitroreductase
MTTNDPTLRKPIDTSYPLHPLIAERWSPRSFVARLPSADVIATLLEAARWAPSAANAQPWRFLIATTDRPDEHARMLEVLSRSNARWARLAPLLLLVATELAVEYEGHPARRSYFDAGLAVGLLIVQAAALGLSVHPMGGFNPEKARRAYHIPNQFEIVAAVAVGYQGTSDHLPEDLVTRERDVRTRKPADEIVFEGTWGRPAALGRDVRPAARSSDL